MILPSQFVGYDYTEKLERFTSLNNKHMLQCPLLAQPCSLDDLLEFNGMAKNCVEHRKHRV